MINNMTKTIIFIDFLPISGSCTGLLTQIRYMTQNYRNQYRCIVIGSVGSILEKNEEKLPYRFYGTSDAVELKELSRNPLKTTFNYIKTLFFVFRITLLEHVDIMHCYHYMWSVYVAPVGLVLRRPVVIHLKDMWPLQPKIARILMKCNPRSRYIAVSKYVFRLFVEKYNVPKSKIDLIYDGIDSPIYSPITARAVQKKFESKQKEIVMLSRIAPERDAEVFIDTAGLLTKTHKDIHFTHYGYDNRFVETDYFASLTNRVKALGLTSKFSFHPYVSDAKKVARIFHKSFLSIIPARQFALPNVAIESLMCGTPVIARHVGGNAEIVNIANGVLIDFSSSVMFAEEVAKLLSQEKRYVSMAVTGMKKTRKKFDAKKQYELIIRLYDTLL